MPKHSNKQPAKAAPASETKPAGFQWDMRPEPAATPRDRRWLLVSIAALAIWFAVLGWLAFR
jgi:hypothetical protein